MKLGVVVLNWNGKDVTPRCLESLYRGICPPDQVVVVDNASVDGSTELLREKFPQAELILNDSNLGFAEGCNVGIRYLLERAFDLVLLLNNDAVVNPDCLGELIRAAQTHPAAAYGATIYELEPPEKVWYAGGSISRLTLDARHELSSAAPSGTARPTDFITGCCVMFRSDALRRIGLLDSDFFAYYEDVDWCLRALGSNAQLLHVPAAIVRHDVSHTFRKAGERDVRAAQYHWMQSQPLVLYLAYRNRLLLATKHAGGSLHLGFLVLRRLGRAALHALLLILVGQGRQAKAIVDGSYDGLRRPLACPCAALPSCWAAEGALGRRSPRRQRHLKYVRHCRPEIGNGHCCEL
jgi:GT2 family glycosyltransferase